jgi:hypothetical protein
MRIFWNATRAEGGSGLGHGDESTLIIPMFQYEIIDLC